MGYRANRILEDAQDRAFDKLADLLDSGDESEESVLKTLMEWGLETEFQEWYDET